MTKKLYTVTPSVRFNRRALIEICKRKGRAAT